MRGLGVEATAEGLPPNRKVNLLWGTVDGGWVIEDYAHFRGKKFTETRKPLAQADVDGGGRLSTRFTIPDDYGGVHEVFVTDGDTTIAQGGIEVGQTFELHPAEGPVGTMIELRAKGFGWRTLESTWVVNWDNQEVGWVSATSTRGTAVARFRATGPVPVARFDVWRRVHGSNCDAFRKHRGGRHPCLDPSGIGIRSTHGWMRFRDICAGGFGICRGASKL